MKTLDLKPNNRNLMKTFLRTQLEELQMFVLLLR